ncbi:MAG TPA: biosynthetic peptidoglycan transglycosylase, partial [Nocardioides sp.]|nr:biosynthetic peptidoglycan transglycosylase [Nocardioides sp.]
MRTRVGRRLTRHRCRRALRRIRVVSARTRRQRVLHRIVRAALVPITVLCLLGAVAYHQLTDGLRVNPSASARVTLIEYSDGTIMAKLGDEDRTPVPLAQMAQSVTWAVLAAEDRGFFTEPGFSIKGTVRAAVSDVGGGTSEGGSGLTQQYVKNAYLSQEHSLLRKVKELAIAVKVNSERSKKQILEDYLNTVYSGRGAYGVEAAAEAYFDTRAARLSLAQSAYLAALL